MKHLTIDDRMLIQACLAKGMSMSEIAKRIGKNKSTVSREIKRHLTIYNSLDFVNKTCKNVIVCNFCKKKLGCNFRKKYYNFETANAEAKSTKSNASKYTRLSHKQVKFINDILVDQVRNLRQSLHHVYVSNPILKNICSERTIRRLMYRNEVEVKPHELRKYVVYKHEYEKPKKFLLKDISILVGRTYKDYINYVNKHKGYNIVQYDSVIGKQSDEKAILTITMPKYAFQFGFLIKKSNANDVTFKIRALFRKLGSDFVKKAFPINLSDNGIEFSRFNEIETTTDGEVICRAFFTSPYKATDKPHCERYHEFIRYMIPKGKSLDSLTQEKVNWIFSQINSYIRLSKGDRTPYDLVRQKFGLEFLNTIGISRVQKKKVSLVQIL